MMQETGQAIREYRSCSLEAKTAIIDLAAARQLVRRVIQEGPGPRISLDHMNGISSTKGGLPTGCNSWIIGGKRHTECWTVCHWIEEHGAS